MRNKTLLRLPGFVLFWLFTTSSNAQELSVHPALFGDQYYEDSYRIPQHEAQQLIRSVPEAYDNWKKFRTNRIASMVAGVATMGCMIWTVESSYGVNNRAEIRRGPAFATLAAYGGQIAFSAMALANRRKALLIYNEKVTSGPELGLSVHGLCLIWRL